MGVPQPDEIVRRFLIKKINDLPVKFEEFETEQIYIKSEDKNLDGFAFVRRRGNVTN